MDTTPFSVGTNFSSRNNYSSARYKFNTSQATGNAQKLAVFRLTGPHFSAYDQNKCKYEHFSRNVVSCFFYVFRD